MCTPMSYAGSAPAYGSRGFHCCMMGMLNHPSKKNLWGSIEPHLPTLAMSAWAAARCNLLLQQFCIRPTDWLACLSINHDRNWSLEAAWSFCLSWSRADFLLSGVLMVWILYSWSSLTNLNWMLAVINLIHPPLCSFSLMWKLGSNMTHSWRFCDILIVLAIDGNGNWVR